MASTLARVTDFVPATPILSGEVDSEFNQIVNLLNGTSSNIKATLDVSDAGDPPLELNQLSTGPILELYQAGILKAQFRNDGGLFIPEIRDANGNEQLIFAATASAVNEFTMTNAAAAGRPKISATGGDTDIGIDIIPKGTGVVKIQAGDPVADADAANKQYVDARRKRWAATFFIADMAARPVDANFDNIQGALIPGGNFIATHVEVVANSGTNTGAFIIEFRKRAFGGGAQTSLQSINWNPGLGSTLEVGQEDDITADGRENLAENDYVFAVVSANASALQRSVWCTVRGYQISENP